MTAVHSVAGTLPPGQPLITRPPFQDPHHTATVSSVVGGGSGVARPGAASLAHGGVLFLDEAPEFGRGVLDALRQPLESGRLSIRRVGGTAVYPARFTLVLAANPCPCARREQDCTCAPDARRRYLARLSGPLLDRVDMHVQVPRITRAELLAEQGLGEPSAAVAARVAAARGRAAARYAGTPWRTNGEVPGVELLRRWPLPRAATRVAEQALDSGLLTARGYGRVARLAWTLADLQDAGVPGEGQVAMALGYRLGPRPWGRPHERGASSSGATAAGSGPRVSALPQRSGWPGSRSSRLVEPGAWPVHDAVGGGRRRGRGRAAAAGPRRRWASHRRWPLRRRRGRPHADPAADLARLARPEAGGWCARATRSGRPPG